MTFMYLMEKQKPFTDEIIQRHGEYLKKLKSRGKLILCGPFTDYPGGVVIFDAEDFSEAKKIAEADPFITFGFNSYEIRTIEVANEDNNYLL